MVTSLLLPVQSCHYISHVCWSSAILTYICLYSVTLLSDIHAVFIYSDTCICTASPSDKASGLLQIHITCLLVRCCSRWFVNLSAKLDAILNISNSEWCVNSNHWDVTRMISVIQESVKFEFCMQIPGVYWSQGIFSYIFCNKLPTWQLYCLHSYFIFIWIQA